MADKNCRILPNFGKNYCQKLLNHFNLGVTLKIHWDILLLNSGTDVALVNFQFHVSRYFSTISHKLFMLDYQREFISYALSCGALKFGEFLLKSGRTSPYFFNTGLFDTGAKLGKLGAFYAQTLLHAKIPFDVLYGPAYKGIPLVASTAIAYAQLSGYDAPFVFNRKEAKDHGEGGLLVGAELCGKVVIVDDVITAGTSVRESVGIIRSIGATPTGVICALDRQEKGQDELSAIQQVINDYGIPVFTIISLETIIQYLTETHNRKEIAAIQAYQQRYGV